MSNASATIPDLEKASLGPFRIYDPSKRTEDEMLRWSARCNFHFEYSHLVAQYIVTLYASVVSSTKIFVTLDR